MFIGAYLCASALVFFAVLLTIVLRADPESRIKYFRKYILHYSLLAVLLSSLGFVVFIGSSVWSNILLIGQPQEFSLPQDYIEHGIAGWAILLVAILGLLSPIAAALLVRRD